MMKSIVEEKLVSFKTLEQKVFRYVCELLWIMLRTVFWKGLIIGFITGEEEKKKSDGIKN